MKRSKIFLEENYFEDYRIGWAIHESVKVFSVLRDLLIELTASPSIDTEEYIMSVKPIIGFICDRNSPLVMLIQHG